MIRWAYEWNMASLHVLTPTRARIIAALCLAALATVVTFHVVATAQHVRGAGAFGFDVEADYDAATMLWETQGAQDGDYIQVAWERAGFPFSPIFESFDFYIVPGGQAELIESGEADLLFQARDTEMGSCCTGGTHLIQKPDHFEELAFVWIFQYDPAWAPQEPENMEFGGLIGTSGGSNRDLDYVRAFAESAMRANRFGEQFTGTSQERLAQNTPYMVAEGILAAGALTFMGAAIRRPTDPRHDGPTGSLVALVQRGRDHLLGLLTMYIIMGPLLLLVAAFGLEAIDNGGFNFFDPVGVYRTWIEVGLSVLWLFSVGLWLSGLVKVLRSLWHYRNTQAPDLGDVSA